jgi:hypothetical protein
MVEIFYIERFVNSCIHRIDHQTVSKQKSRNSNGGITASSLFSASLRWNYPNRFVGSPYPVKVG